MRSCFFVLSVLMCSTAIQAAAPTTSPDIASLIAQLNADDWRTRQSAEDELVKMGEPSRAAAVAIAKTTASAEQRARADSVLARLNAAIANAPTLITLKMTDANPHYVFKAIAGQAHIELLSWPPSMWDHRFGNHSKVSVDFHDTPFWMAVENVCGQANMRVQDMNQGSGNHLTIMQGGSDELAGPKAVSGRYIVVPISATRSSNVSYLPGHRMSSDSSMRMKLYVDPKLSVANIDSAEVIEAVDDKGHSMNAPTDSTRYYGYNGSQQVFDFGLKLAYANDNYTQLSNLKGKVLLTINSASVTVKLPDVEHSLHKTIVAGPYTFEVESLKVQPTSAKMTLKVHCSDVSDQQNIYMSLREIVLVDAKGQTFAAGGSSGGSNRSEYTYTGDYGGGKKIAPPLKLVWKLVTQTSQETVPFEFHDLPLPRP